MLKITDYSTHRGGVVTLLPKIHAMFKDNAQSDKTGVLKHPGHIITWQQQIKKQLTDINQRFIIATEGTELAGLLFYRYENGSAYIEEMQFAKTYENQTAAFDGIFKKLEMDKAAHGAVFYVSDRIKLERNKEILAAAGFKESIENGYEKLGSLAEAAAGLRLRFFAKRATENFF